jgi:hemerythrin-like domain-containing protein
MFDEIASEMVLVHNMMIRALNSIYLQAPYIKPADEKGFCRYMLLWHLLLHSHHSTEETGFFPTVEKMAGAKGIMNANVEQHKAFHDGMEKFKGYADAVIADKEKYSGSKVVAIIDEFGPVLTQHLTDEIPTIAGLRQYGKDKMGGLIKAMEVEGETAMVRPSFD